jgi:hypothetical protein
MIYGDPSQEKEKPQTIAYKSDFNPSSLGLWASPSSVSNGSKRFRTKAVKPPTENPLEMNNTSASRKPAICNHIIGIHKAKHKNGVFY